MSQNPSPLNGLLRDLDAKLIEAKISPEQEMGVIAMLAVLAFRRLAMRHGAFERGVRHRLAKTATNEILGRLMEYGDPRVEKPKFTDLKK